jgi:hypothetical protein
MEETGEIKGLPRDDGLVEKPLSLLMMMMIQ